MCYKWIQPHLNCIDSYTHQGYNNATLIVQLNKNADWTRHNGVPIKGPLKPPNAPETAQTAIAVVFPFWVKTKNIPSSILHREIFPKPY